MFRLILGMVFAIAVVNAGFHHKFHHHLNKYFTYDVNGFKGHHSEHGMYNVPFAPAPPPPQFGPYPHNHHHYHHHDFHHNHNHDHHPDFPGYHNHGPQCHHNHDNGFPNMVWPFNPFLVPNMPFNPMHPFNVPNFNPNQNNEGIPNQSIPTNQPLEPTNPTGPNTANNLDPFNVNVQNGMSTQYLLQTHSTNVDYVFLFTCITSQIKLSINYCKCLDASFVRITVNHFLHECKCISS